MFVHIFSSTVRFKMCLSLYSMSNMSFILSLLKTFLKSLSELSCFYFELLMNKMSNSANIASVLSQSVRGVMVGLFIPSLSMGVIWFSAHSLTGVMRRPVFTERLKTEVTQSKWTALV